MNSIEDREKEIMEMRRKYLIFKNKRDECTRMIRKLENRLNEINENNSKASQE